MGDRVSVGVMIKGEYLGVYIHYKGDIYQDISDQIHYFGKKEFVKMMRKYPSGGSSLKSINQIISPWGKRDDSLNDLFLDGIAYDVRGDGDGRNISRIGYLDDDFVIKGSFIEHYQYGKLVNSKKMPKPTSLLEIFDGMFNIEGK